MKVRGATIEINALILTDKAALERACADAMGRVAEAVQHDVTQIRRDTFAHNEGNWSSQKYGGGDYYSSGLIPYWRGGLLGSFQPVDGGDWSEKIMAFTASYAPLIENGGFPGDLPMNWLQDKVDRDADKDGFTFSIHPHNFVSEVAQKLNDHLEDFGYLDVFATHFLAEFNRL
jgi:hypothetical protein